MTKEDAIEVLQNPHEMYCDKDGNVGYTFNPSTKNGKAFDMAIKALEQEPCEDAVSRKAVNELFDSEIKMYEERIETRKGSNYHDETERIKEFRSRIANAEYWQNKIKALPPATPTQKWIPVSERLPKEFEFVNCTCHSLIDDREDWVVETVYIPQLSDSQYSDWGNIPMLNNGECEVIAWMHRNIPEPYRA